MKNNRRQLPLGGRAERQVFSGSVFCVFFCRSFPAAASAGDYPGPHARNASPL